MAWKSLPRCPVCGNEIPEDSLANARNNQLFCPKPFCAVSLALTEGQNIQLETFQLVNHYSLCILPFSFTDTSPEEIFQRMDQSLRWQRRTFSVEDTEDIDRTEYFLPYIRHFLFPGLRAAHENTDSGERTCHRWTFSLNHLSENDDSFRFLFTCQDSRKYLDFAWQFELLTVEMILFEYRVGFLILEFQHCDDRVTYFDQMAALNYLRPIAPLYRGFAMPKLNCEEKSFQIPQLLAYLLAEFNSQTTSRTLPSSPQDISLPVRLPVHPAYDDRMVIYSFSCIDKNTCLMDQEQNSQLLQRAAVVRFNDPSSKWSTTDSAENTEREWQRRRWQAFSKDGTCLVVFDTDRFHERFLGTYHATYYFDIFLLAILQRVTLLTLFEELSYISGLTGNRRNRNYLRRVRRDLLLFKNQCCFSQITNRERGLELWRQWQITFENATLLTEVNEQATELDNYLQGRMRERIENFLRLGGFLAAAIPIILGLDALFPAREYGNWVNTLRVFLLLLLIVGSAIFAAYLLFRQEEE